MQVTAGARVGFLLWNKKCHKMFQRPVSQEWAGTLLSSEASLPVADLPSLITCSWHWTNCWVKGGTNFLQISHRNKSQLQQHLVRQEIQKYDSLISTDFRLKSISKAVCPTCCFIILHPTFNTWVSLYWPNPFICSLCTGSSHLSVRSLTSSWLAHTLGKAHQV